MSWLAEQLLASRDWPCSLQFVRQKVCNAVVSFNSVTARLSHGTDFKDLNGYTLCSEALFVPPREHAASPLQRPTGLFRIGM
jgi:hypothetical protein